MTVDDHIARAPGQVLEGIESYARGDYFASHEHFEAAWRASGSPRSLELHALAQVAAALHKQTSHRKPEAARAIMRRARDKLARVEASSHAIDLDALRARIDAWLHDPEGSPPSITCRS